MIPHLMHTMRGPNVGIPSAYTAFVVFSRSPHLAMISSLPLPRTLWRADKMPGGYLVRDQARTAMDLLRYLPGLVGRCRSFRGCDCWASAR
jgi:hypothetical protein